MMDLKLEFCIRCAQPKVDHLLLVWHLILKTEKPELLRQHGMVLHTLNLSIRHVETGISEIQGHPHILNYIMSSRLA